MTVNGTIKTLFTTQILKFYTFIDKTFIARISFKKSFSSSYLALTFSNFIFLANRRKVGNQ